MDLNSFTFLPYKGGKIKKGWVPQKRGGGFKRDQEAVGVFKKGQGLAVRGAISQKDREIAGILAGEGSGACRRRQTTNHICTMPHTLLYYQL